MMTSTQVRAVESMLRNMLVVTEAKEFTISREWVEETLAALEAQWRTIDALSESVSTLKRQLVMHRRAERLLATTRRGC